VEGNNFRHYALKQSNNLLEWGYKVRTIAYSNVQIAIIANLFPYVNTKTSFKTLRNILMLTKDTIPPLLQAIPSPPKLLYVKGGTLDEILARPRIAIVGSRKVTPYGKQVTIQLAEELARKGVVIVSGLALGVDSLAHQAALDARGLTMAILPTSVNEVYPADHRDLAANILRSGGVLLSEYPDGTPGYRQNFVARNRLVSGISDGVLITEAAKGSGTLHTARFALQQGKKLFVVPGNITSTQSSGANQLIKDGAQLVTSADDIFTMLGMVTKTGKQKAKPTSQDPNEQIILDLLYNGVSDAAELRAQSKLPVALFNQTLTMLEITGDIKPLGNNHWTLN
jgi:DNA processing protein